MKHEVVTASPDSLLALLRALGAPIHSAAGAANALRARRQELADSMEPVRVAWNGRINRRQFRNAERGTLILEHGKTVRWPAETLPPGYHRLVVERSGSQQECLIISAPVKSIFPCSRKTWGVFAPTYALKSRRSFGAGDLTDLETLLSWTAEAGGQVVSTLPLLAAFLDKPFDPSPYSPASRLFWNEFFADLEKPPEFALSADARRLFARKPHPANLVDYRELMSARRRILEAMCGEFFSPTSGRGADFDAFSRSGSEVLRYAEFRAAGERQERGWRKWPARMRDGRIERRDRDERAVRYHLYAQWVMHQQLQSLKEKAGNLAATLYLDLPLGIHADGFDTWRYPQLFLDGISGGAPPDPVFTTGQNWAFPPLNPQTIRLDHYRYVIASIRNHLKYAQMLRVDHVMGLHHLFCIPEGMEGRHGVYLRYPAEELYAILSLESHRHEAGIVGEDLGLVPPGIRRSMKRHNIRGLYILQVEPRIRAPKPLLRTPPPGSVASLNTHDMFPFAAFLDGRDIDDRMKLGFLAQPEAASERATRVRVKKRLASFVGSKTGSNRDIFEGCLRFLSGSKAAIVLLNLEDLWLETQPQNIPATTKERPNWRRRMRYSIGDLRRSTEMKRILEMMRRKV
jgi:4-alpha-glucanotransferase